MCVMQGGSRAAGGGHRAKKRSAYWEAYQARRVAQAQRVQQERLLLQQQGDSQEGPRAGGGAALFETEQLRERAEELYSPMAHSPLVPPQTPQTQDHRQHLPMTWYQQGRLQRHPQQSQECEPQHATACEDMLARLDAGLVAGTHTGVDAGVVPVGPLQAWKGVLWQAQALVSKQEGTGTEQGKEQGLGHCERQGGSKQGAGSSLHLLQVLKALDVQQPSHRMELVRSLGGLLQGLGAFGHYDRCVWQEGGGRGGEGVAPGSGLWAGAQMSDHCVYSQHFCVPMLLCAGA